MTIQRMKMIETYLLYYYFMNNEQKKFLANLVLPYKLTLKEYLGKCTSVQLRRWWDAEQHEGSIHPQAPVIHNTLA